ncbi:MAG: hypothetical protein ABMA13_15510 [Chthoniobacteraceae bacterium]
MMRRTTAHDGDSAIAADAQGRVHLAWHGITPDGSPQGEADRTGWRRRRPLPRGHGDY